MITVRKASKNQLVRRILKDPFALIGLILLLLFLIVAIFANFLAPYDAYEIIRAENGEIKKLYTPSIEHPFGTTNIGRDLFSQVIFGTRTAISVGFIAALLVTFVGVMVGLISGYFGGITDIILMRIVDVFYAIPFIPFVIVLVALLKPSIWNVILAISLLSWRTVARIIRSQVLTIAKRPFIKAAIVSGAGHLRIMVRYILPSVLPIALLEMAFIVNSAIMTEASVSFLGLGDPNVISWGQILHTNFLTGHSQTAWWWVAPPGIAIVLLLLSIFFLTRSFEEVIHPRLKRRS
ncbi:peptide ABC transporter permease [Ammoniphilus oxalaticus]|uniref:Peptide ABC transporter permease n=1 Tax=Ammoniphilus oxalaticus TaxID=66863 RepID=A0A419SHF4_9BACL|nr:ABC transporter permease [Ammoniphilus oxalaticus]RKD23218.1 peptide ABC transporter permease [Ammoniphilus oxalaticus]